MRQFYGAAAYGHTTLKYAISSDLASQAMLGPASTWIGDGLGTPGVVSLCFMFVYSYVYFEKVDKVANNIGSDILGSWENNDFILVELFQFKIFRNSDYIVTNGLMELVLSVI